MMYRMKVKLILIVATVIVLILMHILLYVSYHYQFLNGVWQLTQEFAKAIDVRYLTMVITPKKHGFIYGMAIDGEVLSDEFHLSRGLFGYNIADSKILPESVKLDIDIMNGTLTILNGDEIIGDFYKDNSVNITYDESAEDIHPSNDERS